MKNTILFALLGLGLIAMPAQADSVRGWGVWGKGSVEDLQAAILAGADPTTDGEETAAGPAGTAFSAFSTPTSLETPKPTLVVSTVTPLTRRELAIITLNATPKPTTKPK